MLTIISILGLFLGLTSLWVFLLGISPWGINLITILLGMILIVVLEYKFLISSFDFKGLSWPKIDLLQWLMIGVMVASSIRILVYSVFYPFVNWDTLAIYGLEAKKIFLSGNLTNIYGQPPFLSISYAIAFFLSGGLNEFVAKSIPGFLAVLTIPATYLLGKEIFNSKVGLIAAFLLSITPLFKIWSGAGYADIPGTFYFLMTLIYFHIFLKDENKKNLILTGIFLGLSVWAKQSALTLIPSFILLTLFCDKKPFKNLSLIFLIGFLFGGFWYLRNLFLTREFFPAAVSWWSMANHNIRNLLPFVGFTNDFGYWLAPIYTVSFIFALVMIKKRELSFLLSFVLPYFFLWWFFYSYETRFLLTILPILGILCAFFIEEVFLKEKNTIFFPRLIGIFAILFMSASTLYSALNIDILKDRNLTLDQKRSKFLGDTYKTIEFLKEREPFKIITTDNRITYFLDKNKVLYLIPHKSSDFDGYNYFLLSSWANITSSREGWSFDSMEVGKSLNNSNRFKKIFTSGEYSLYEIRN